LRLVTEGKVITITGDVNRAAGRHDLPARRYTRLRATAVALRQAFEHAAVELVPMGRLLAA